MNLIQGFTDYAEYEFYPSINLREKGYNVTDFYLQINNKHNWQEYKGKLWGREEYESLAKCKCCDTISMRMKKDSYIPDVYIYFVRYPIEFNLSCHELVIKNIVE